jgi:hypothetical protein
MTLQEAKNLKWGDYIHCPTKFNADKTPMRARITSIKTWKRSPEKIEVHYKRGMYEYGIIRAHELEDFNIGYGS